MTIVTSPVVTNRSVTSELEALFREHYRVVYQTAYGIVGNTADAEDVLQTIFLRLMRREFHAEFHSNPKGYFYRAAVNLSLDMIRSRRRVELVDDLQQFESVVDQEDSNHDEELHRRLTNAIAELNPVAAHILILRYVHNYSDAEIAKLLGTSRGAIALRLFRSRARLKKLLTEFGGE